MIINEHDLKAWCDKCKQFTIRKGEEACPWCGAKRNADYVEVEPAEPPSLIPPPDKVWGIDPGTRHMGICRADGQRYLRLTPNVSGKTLRDWPFLEYVSRRIAKICEDALFVAIERPFDRSRGHKLERLVHVLEATLYTARLRPFVFEVNPVYLKLWVTGGGRPDEAEYWRRVQSNIEAGKYPQPLAAIDDQHVVEACLMGNMLLDWCAYRLEGGRRLTGYVRGVEKLQPLWQA